LTKILALIFLVAAAHAASALPPPPAVHHPVAPGQRGSHLAPVGGPVKHHGGVGGPAPRG